jgi:ATP-dependent Clp protease adaptor protein ClpS
MPHNPLENNQPEEGEAAVAEELTESVAPPPMYQVVLLNDDFTPMEFVVMVLQEYFQRDIETATQIMLQIHHEGRGVCGLYTKDVAATKVELVMTAARRDGHPLQCIMETA